MIGASLCHSPTQISNEVTEKQRVCTLYWFYYLLNCLTAKKIPIGKPFCPLQLGNMNLDPIGRQRLAKHTVVSFVKRNAMIVDLRIGFDLVMQFTVAVITVEFVLERFHIPY